MQTDDPEAQAELQRQTQNQINEEIEEKQKEMLALLNDGGGGGAGRAAKEGTAPTPTNYDVEYPIGALVADIAAGHPQGEQWMGNITNNPAIQCDS